MHLSDSSVDILWTIDGDFYMGEQGDLERASSYKNRILESSIVKRLSSSSGDWRIGNFPAANLMEIMGLPNDPNTAAYLKSSIFAALTADDLIRGSEMDIEIIPLSQEEIMCVLLVAPLDKQGEPLTFGFTYDLRDNKMVPRIINT